MLWRREKLWRSVSPDAPILFVLAGVNGAGKSSVGGAKFSERGRIFFNPDEAARAIRKETGCPFEEANAQAWQVGKEQLQTAIRRRESYSFESTLGANTIPRLLREAAQSGFRVKVWFVGLSSAEQHISRVRARVAAGGHDIPEAKIRERWNGSRRNIIMLLPYLTELRVFDNSQERDPVTGVIPPPKLLLHWMRGAIVAPSVSELESTPDWAMPIVVRALELQRMNS
jgi:predicted ABC-type ATPase